MSSAKAYRQLFTELLEQGKYQEAARRAAEELARNPGDRQALGFLVEGLLRYGHTPQAAGVLRNVLAAAPGNDLAAFGLALALETENAGESGQILRELLTKDAADLFQGQEGPVKISPVVEAAGWAGPQEQVVLEPAEDVRVFDPACNAEAHYRSEEVVAVTLAGATVVANWDWVITPEGEVLNGSGFQDIGMGYKALRHFYHPKTKRVIHAWPAECIEVDEDVLFLSGPPPLAFGHWISDFLPRLKGWIRPNRPALKIAAWRTLDRHECDTLALFGVRGSDILWCDPGKRYRFRNLTFVRTGDMYRPNPAVIRFLHRGLGPDPATRSKRSEMGRRFFLQRSGTARGRYIANPDAFHALLEELGFEFVRRPEVPVPQQNEMFRDAGIVLGIFGTDLVTLYQLRPGTDLVALYPDYLREPDVKWGTLAFAAMCEIVGVRLHVIHCATTAAEDVKEYYRDIIVDCDAVRDRLYDIIERRSLDYAQGWAPTRT